MKLVAILVLAAAMASTAATSTAATPQLQPGIAKLTPAQKHALLISGLWHRGCPVQRRHLRVVTTRYYGFDHRTHMGQIVVNETVARSILHVFRDFYRMRFPIRKMSFEAVYRLHTNWGGDLTASFECRNAGSSPCTGNVPTKNWSMHAYGMAVDLNPRENPYVGCGMTRDKTAISYMKRSNVRPGMVTPAIYRKTIARIGWGWGGLWSGSTKDYMHFSTNGH